MIDKFVITGLPRSRTGWFAAYLTTGDTLCYHEAIAYGYDMGTTDYAHVGTADSGYILRPEWVKSLGDHKLVVIHRDPAQVATSLSTIADVLDFDACQSWLTTNDRLLQHKKGLHIEYDDINTQLQVIHEYLGLPFSQERADVFIPLNIQAHDWR